MNPVTDSATPAADIDREDDPGILHLRGRWTLRHAGAIATALATGQSRFEKNSFQSTRPIISVSGEPRSSGITNSPIAGTKTSMKPAITPGIESPTVSPLHDKGYVAVRAMVKRQGMNKVMDTLYGLGARGILVTDIAACRL